MVKSRFHWDRQGSLEGSTLVDSVNSIFGLCAYMPYLPSSLINARQIYLGYKLNRWRNIWIAIATVYVQAVYSVLMSALKCRKESARYPFLVANLILFLSHT